MPIERKKICKKYLLLCEGKDAELFFVNMLSSPEFCEDKRIADEIQILDFGGIKNLSNYLQLLKVREGFSNVKSILVIRDAENNAKAAVNSIKNSFQSNGFSVPDELLKWQDGDPKTAFALLPGLDKTYSNGALEDLCCSLIAEINREDIFEEVDAFLDKMSTTYGFYYPRIFKNRLHTYLSAKDEFVSFKIGEAAMAKAFDWKSKKLDNFRKLLLESFN